MTALFCCLLLKEELNLIDVLDVLQVVRLEIGKLGLLKDTFGSTIIDEVLTNSRFESHLTVFG